MRVALVSEHASPLAALGGVDAGGQNVHVAALAHHLARRGVTVDVYTRRDSGALPPRVALAPRVVVHHVTAGPPHPVPKDELLPHMGQFADELRRAFGRRVPDAVHAHFWMSGLAAHAAAAPLDVPVALTFHALGIVKHREQGTKDTSPPERLEIERRLLDDVDHVVATCSDEAFELLRLGLPARKVTVAPCGVDLDLFTPEGTTERRSGSERYRIGVVTRLVERKGVGNVIEALRHVPDAELVVVGGPDAHAFDHDPEVRRLRQIAAVHGVAGRVHLRGRLPREAVPAFLRSCDVVACTPWYEPFGIVPLEAMACGVPVVATAVGGMLDTVVDGVTGVHVPPRSPERLAEALCELLADPERRARLGAAGAHRAQNYSWDRVTASVLDVYEALLARRPAPVTWPGRMLEKVEP